LINNFLITKRFRGSTGIDDNLFTFTESDKSNNLDLIDNKYEEKKFIFVLNKIINAYEKKYFLKPGK